MEKEKTKEEKDQWGNRIANFKVTILYRTTKFRGDHEAEVT